MTTSRRPRRALPSRAAEAAAPPRAGRLLLGGSLAGAALLGLLEYAVPRRPLPSPTGPTPVGTTSVQLDTPARTLPVQIWYPATAAGGRPAPLFAAGRRIGPAMSSTFPPPSGVFGLLARAHGHAVTGVTPAWTSAAGGRVPTGVLLISHGWLGFRAIHADIAEQMASEGWVVVAPDHVGGALVTQHVDGRVEPLQPTLMPTAGDHDYWPRARALVSRYADDLRAVLAAVHSERLSPLVPAVPARTLVLGQSTGGGAAVAVAASTQGVDGVVGLDPWVEPVPSAQRAALAVPFAAVRSSQWVGNRNDGLLAQMPTAMLSEVTGAVHTDLTAIGWLSPLVRLAGLSSVPASAPLAGALAGIDAVSDAVEDRAARRAADAR